MSFKKIFKNYRFSIMLILSIVIGSIIGIIFKENAMKLKPFGTLFINMLYTIVVPLVFFTISSSIANMKSLRRLGKIFKYMFITFIITSLIATLIMLIVLFFINPVSKDVLIETGTKEVIDIGTKIVEMITVTDFGELFSKSHMFPLIIFSCLFGLSVQTMGEKGSGIARGLKCVSEVMMKFINFIMYYAPIGLIAYFAALVGEYGQELIGSYAKSMVLYYVVSVLYFFIMYYIYSYIARGKKGARQFFRNILPTTLTSLGTCSSLASLPTNLETCDKIGVSKDVREVTLPIGATMHMEGSSMAAILKIVFLFGIFGRSFTGIDTYLVAILIAVLSGVVMSGIPGGGLIGEMLIVSMYGFNASALPIIATIGWIVDPPATTLNVVGDVTSAMLIDKNLKNKEIESTT